jgi:hypothetical protein
MIKFKVRSSGNLTVGVEGDATGGLGLGKETSEAHISSGEGEGYRTVHEGISEKGKDRDREGPVHIGDGHSD